MTFVLVVPFVLVAPVVKSCSTALRGSGTGHASAAGRESKAGAIVLTCLRKLRRCARLPAKCLAEDETSAEAGVRHALGTSTVLPCAPEGSEADGTAVPASAFSSTVGPERGAAAGARPSIVGPEGGAAAGVRPSTSVPKGARTREYG